MKRYAIDKTRELIARRQKTCVAHHCLGVSEQCTSATNYQIRLTYRSHVVACDVPRRQCGGEVLHHCHLMDALVFNLAATQLISTYHASFRCSIMTTLGEISLWLLEHSAVHTFMPPPYAAMLETKIIRPHFWAFMPSTTPLTSRNGARRFTFKVISNSFSGISETSRILLP